MCPISDEEQARLDNEYRYHAPRVDQVRRYEVLRNQAKGLAMLVMDSCPPSPERSTALRYISEAVMNANAAIARHDDFPADNSDLDGMRAGYHYSLKDIERPDADIDLDRSTASRDDLMEFFRHTGYEVIHIPISNASPVARRIPADITVVRADGSLEEAQGGWVVQDGTQVLEASAADGSPLKLNDGDRMQIRHTHREV